MRVRNTADKYAKSALKPKARALRGPFVQFAGKDSGVSLSSVVRCTRISKESSKAALTAVDRFTFRSRRQLTTDGSSSPALKSRL